MSRGYAIRIAGFNDIGGAIPLLREFHEESLKEYALGFDHRNAQVTADTLLRNGIAFVIEADNKELVGICAGTLAPYSLNRAKTIFQEAVWYVRKDYRMAGVRLYEYVEKYCKEAGVDAIVMGHMGNCKSEKLAKFYTYRGYKPMEVHYVRVI